MATWLKFGYTRDERGLVPGITGPQQRPEGDQGRCAGCLRRARAHLSPSVTVDLVCLVGAGHPRCSRRARSRRARLVPSDAAGGGARPGCSIEVPGGGDDALHGRRDHPAAGALSLAGAPAGQHLAGRCSGDGRMLREVLVDDRPRPRSPEGCKQWLVCQVLAARLSVRC